MSSTYTQTQLFTDLSRPMVIIGAAALLSVIIGAIAYVPAEDIKASTVLEEVIGPRIVSREAWGARDWQGEDAPLPNIPKVFVIHHSSIPSAADYTGPATIRGIQNSHIDGNNWSE